MRRKIWLVNLILFAAVMAVDMIYMEHGGLWRKGLASFGFVLIGGVNFAVCCRRTRITEFPMILVAGLFFCMLGDIVLNLSFIPGTALFALGHVLYFVSYCRLSKLKLLDLIPIGVIFAASVLIIKCIPILVFDDALLEWVCICYALVISMMWGKAVGNLLRERKLLHFLLVLGCALFYFSDLMLVFDWFSDAPDVVGTLCMLTYYPAQCLLAFSLTCVNRKEK